MKGLTGIRLFVLVISSMVFLPNVFAQFDTLSVKNSNFLKWESLGPNYRVKGFNNTIGIGRFTSLWVNPDNFEHILAGSNSGGLWKTTNGGKNWQCITDSIATGGISDIAVDEKEQNLIYITTRTSANGTLKFSGIYSMGVFKSNDGGNTWQKLDIGERKKEYFERIAIDPTNRSVLYVLTNKSVYLSKNQGKTWKRTALDVPDNVSFTDMEFKPGEPSTIYVSGKNGLYVTRNKGKNWLSIRENLPGGFVNTRMALAVNPINPNEVYILSTDLDNQKWGNTPNRLEFSPDCGVTWKLLTDRKFSAMAHTCEIAISPSGKVFAGGEVLITNNESDIYWKSLTINMIHPDIQKIVFPDKANGNLIYVTCDGGILKDSTGGNKWQYINGDLATNEFYSVAINEKNPEIMVGGTHDCGSYYRDITGTWNYVSGGDGGTSLIDYENPDIYYVTSNASFSRESKTESKNIIKLEQYNSPVLMHPTNASTLYASQWIKGDTPPVHIKKTTDKGNKWTTLEQEWSNVTGFAVPFSNPDFIYYSMWDSWATSKIRRSTDGGETWSNVNHSSINNICADAPITNILANPFNPLQVWISFGGFEKNKKIYFSKNGGNSWENISGSQLPNVPAQCIQYDFVNKTLFLGTDIGLYQLKHLAKEWEYVNGFPKVMVSSLQINKQNGDLVASTYGRGVWRTNLGMGFCEETTDAIEIFTDTEWKQAQEICFDVIVKSGSKLTVKANCYLPYKSSIVVQPGASLIVDGVTISAGSIIIEEGGKLEEINGGEAKEIFGD